VAKKPSPAVLAELPLKPVTFEILLVLAAEELHGYAIVKRLEERSGGSMQLEPANLYRTLRTMTERELIAETEHPTEPKPADQRRRYFGITAFGRDVARAEAARLDKLVEDARAQRLLAGGGRKRYSS
jgi:DNA-binding PadR family transcriptional regulator